MSVHAHHYVMLGANLGGDFPKLFTDEQWEKLLDREVESPPNPMGNQIVVLHDGMNGQYTYAGLVVAEGSEDEGLEPIALPVAWDSGVLRILLADLLSRMFDLANRPEIAYHVLTHCR